MSPEAEIHRSSSAQARRESPSFCENVRFDDFELDVDRVALSKSGRFVHVQPKVFRLMAYLVRERHRVVSKEELLGLLWPGEAVVPAVLTTAMRSLRAALGDEGRSSRYIRTVRSAGYQFVGPVRPGAAAHSPDSTRALARTDFIGREAERRQFRAGIDGPEGATRVLFVHGAPGIGKTTLLHEFATERLARGDVVLRLSSDQMAPTAESWTESFAPVLSLDRSNGGLAFVFVDNYEGLAALDRWVRELFIPGLPCCVRLVVASRNAPGGGWRALAGFGRSIQEMELRAFDAAEARQFLESRQVTPSLVERILRLTGGHPLALALAAQGLPAGASSFELAKSSDLIGALVERFVGDLPDAAHRDVLVTASLAPFADEALFEAVLGEGFDCRHYEWLRSLSFARRTPHGVTIHSLAREALIAEMRGRHPARLRALLGRAMQHWLAGLNGARSVDVSARFARRLLELGRYLSPIRPFFCDDEAARLHAEPATASAHAQLVPLVARHEGAESAAITERWLALQPGDVWLVRDAGEEPVGFVHVLSLGEAERVAGTWDPVVRAVFQHLDEIGRRPGEGALLYRSIMGRDAYQSVSGTMQLCYEILCLNHVVHLSSGEGFTHSYLNFGEPELWGPVNGIFGCQRLTSHAVTLGHRTFELFYYSFRDCPFERWLEQMIELIVTGA